MSEDGPTSGGPTSGIAPAPHDPQDYPNTPDESFRGNVRETNPSGNVRRTPRPRCAFCGAPTKQIGRRLFCRACGYYESCCDGGKEAIREGELREPTSGEPTSGEGDC